jgi:hypothetical protein
VRVPNLNFAQLHRPRGEEVRVFSQNTACKLLKKLRYRCNPELAKCSKRPVLGSYTVLNESILSPAPDRVVRPRRILLYCANSERNSAQNTRGKILRTRAEPRYCVLVVSEAGRRSLMVAPTGTLAIRWRRCGSTGRALPRSALVYFEAACIAF